MDSLLTMVSTDDVDKIVYIAAPYTAKNSDGSEDKIKVADRMRIVSLCVEQFMKQGLFVISPLLMHLVRTYTESLPGDWAYWSNYSKGLLTRCDYVIILTMEGWEESVGVTEEINIARAHDIEIYYADPKKILE